MLPYRILDTAFIEAKPDVLFAALTDFDKLPEWWPSHYHTKTIQSRATVEGREIYFYPNRLITIGWRIHSADPPHSFRLIYTRGWHTGHGLWKFEPEGTGCRISFHIDIHPKTGFYGLVYQLINLPKRHSADIHNIINRLALRVGAGGSSDRTSKQLS
jgi:uncharacterized protein YndB with AHSA1/START domain